MGMGFRAGGRADAARLAPLAEELGYPSSPAELEARLARFEGSPDHAVFVAEEGALLRGWIHVQEFLSVASDPTALVTGLVVDPAVRGRGVGRALIALAEDWARARGLASLRLRSQVRRRGAHAFYERLGYTVVKTQLQFRKDL